MKLAVPLLTLSAIFLLSGCAEPTTADKLQAEQATLQLGTPKQKFLVTFGDPLRNPPAQVSAQAVLAVPAHSTWLAWRVRHKDEKASARFPKSSLVNTTGANGESMSMPMGPEYNGGFRVLFLVAIFDQQDRFVRHIWMENVDESE